jgi:hypothetical protein
MIGNSLDNIPHFLSARTPKGLRVAMLRNNLKWKLVFNYYQIIFDGKRWYAWYQMNAVEEMEREGREE